jgi:hypothetical protein
MKKRPLGVCMEKEKENNIIDYVAYRIQKQIDLLFPGSHEELIQSIVLQLYLDSKVSVRWSGDDMLVSSVSGSFPDELMPDNLGIDENDLIVSGSFSPAE